MEFNCGKIVYSNNAKIYQMNLLDKATGSYKGVGQVWNGESFKENGLNYYSGRLESGNYGQRYEVSDRKAYLQNFSGTPAAEYIQNRTTTDTIWFDQSPNNFVDTQSVKPLFVPSDFNTLDLFGINPDRKPSSPIQNTDAFAQSWAKQNFSHTHKCKHLCNLGRIFNASKTREKKNSNPAQESNY